MVATRSTTGRRDRLKENRGVVQGREQSRDKTRRVWPTQRRSWSSRVRLEERVPPAPILQCLSTTSQRRSTRCSQLELYAGSRLLGPSPVKSSESARSPILQWPARSEVCCRKGGDQRRTEEGHAIPYCGRDRRASQSRPVRLQLSHCSNLDSPTNPVKLHLDVGEQSKSYDRKVGEKATG